MRYGYKFHQEGHCFASQGFAKWCESVIPKDGICYPYRTLMLDSFPCVLMFYSEVEFITMHNDIDVILKFDVNVTILSFRTHRSGQTVQTQSSLIRIFTVCFSICIILMKYSKLLPLCLNFRWITGKFSHVRKFRNFMVLWSQWCEPHENDDVHYNQCKFNVKTVFYPDLGQDNMGAIWNFYPMQKPQISLSCVQEHTLTHHFPMDSYHKAIKHIANRPVHAI